jgi:exopolysaccharide/PEP-CTERM locus tyrosine autokinase
MNNPMSIVEKVLGRLNAKAAQDAAAPQTNAPSPFAGRVASVDATGRSSLRRASIGKPERTVSIDYDRLRRIGLLPPEHQLRELAHQYRTLKRPLIRRAFESQARNPSPSAAALRSIMVTSALPGDGKTFTSLNLAFSLSLERDYSVLLVDGDVAKPRLSNTFGLGKEPGLLDLLEDPNLDVESAVVPTTVHGLSLLPVGRRSETATELLASARMRQVVEKLEELDSHLIVIVDSPPVLLTSEARVLASLFAQVVMVVRASETPQHAVMEAVRIIGEGPRIGLVLNQASNQGGDPYGYYGGEHSGKQTQDRTDSGNGSP